jgi:succinate dehydrogenase / fumarate reductase cytochrome b subunit
LWRGIDPIMAFNGVPMKSQQRPLSPHLQIYKPQMTSVLSIGGRIMGAGLFVGSFMLVWWIAALAIGPHAYEIFMTFIHSWMGIILCTGWAFAFYYYVANGIRHLFWDLGYGYDLKTVYKTGWTVVIFSLIATAATFYHFFLKDLL